MANRDWIIRKLAKYHYGRGDEVYAECCKGFRIPPPFSGTNGDSQTPDIWLKGQRRLYKIEIDESLQNMVRQIEIFANDDRVSVLVLVLSVGNEEEAARVQKALKKEGILGKVRAKVLVLGWRELFEQLGVPKS